MGDFDIDYLKLREPSTKSPKWIEQNTGFKQLIKYPSCFSTIISCIDLIFTNCQKIKCANVHDFNVSDHQMISLTFKHLTEPTISNSIVGRSYKNYDKVESIL